MPNKEKSQTKLAGLPLLEYQDRGHKWVVEYHTKVSAASVGENGVLIVEISDPKQQVYIFNCDQVTVQLKGEKVKSIILDKCSNVNLVFDSCLAACEMVNCKKIQIQTTGTCPSFSIDKTAGCLIYLSHDTMDTTSFVTAQSSEMNGEFTCYPSFLCFVRFSPQPLMHFNMLFLILQSAFPTGTNTKKYLFRSNLFTR